MLTEEKREGGTEMILGGIFFYIRKYAPSNPVTTLTKINKILSSFYNPYITLLPNEQASHCENFPGLCAKLFHLPTDSGRFRSSHAAPLKICISQGITGKCKKKKLLLALLRLQTSCCGQEVMLSHFFSCGAVQAGNDRK